MTGTTPRNAPDGPAGPVPDRDAAWADQEDQEVRPYVVTGGRTRPQHRLRLASLLTAAGAVPGGSTPEVDKAVRLCAEQPRSVAEIAAVLDLPVQVAKVVVSDGIDAGSLALAVPDISDTPVPDHREQLLEALLDGLRALSPTGT